MSYLVLDGFPKGLDVRRFSLAPQPGSLVELSNGHLTNGGEIEKRKAFVLYANVAIAETGAELTAGVRTFGMQETGVGLTVFGSADVFGTGGTHDLASAMPAGVTYQQLQHPAVIDGVTYDKTKHALTAVTGSCVYGGLIFAVATFEDDNVFCYYDGALVRDMTDGLVMAHLDTNTKIATAIKEMVNRSTTSSGYSATSSGANVTITGPLGSVYQISTTVTTSASGVLTATINNAPTSPVSANPATGSFRITGGSALPGTNRITKVEVQSVTVKQTTHRSRVNATSVATLTFAAAHGITAGMIIDVFGIPGYDVVGASVIAAPTTTTITYTKAGADEATTADGSGSVRVGTTHNIIDDAVDWTINNSVTASDIAAEINASTDSPEYIATATDNLVTIQAATSEGDTPNTFEVKVTTAGNVCVGDAVFQFVGTGMSVTSVNIDGAVVTTGAAAFPTTYPTINSLVAGIAADIRAGSATHGYTAFSSGPLLSLSRVVTSSKDAPLDVFVLIGSGTPFVAGSGVTFLENGIPVSAPGVTVAVERQYPSSMPYGFIFRPVIFGGAAPFSYVWSIRTPNSTGNSIVGGLNSETSTIISSILNDLVVVSVTVTDSLGTVITSPEINVYF